MNSQQDKKLFTKMIGTVGALATGIFLAFPGLAIEVNNSEVTNHCATQADNCIPLQPGAFVCINNSDSRCGNPPGNFRGGTLKPGSFACINNSNPVCGNPPGNLRAQSLEPGSFACINNPNSVCKNPRNYEVCP